METEWPGKASHPTVTSIGTWRSIVLVSLSGVRVDVELQVPWPLSIRSGQSSCRLLAGGLGL